MRRIHWKWGLLLAISAALVAVPAAYAQSTRGEITGTVVDNADGSGLPGVTIELSSPNLQGSKTATTDAGGGYRFLGLPPGTYQARFSLEGFQTIEQEAVKVSIGLTARLEVRMTSVFTEAVVVTSETPVVDTTSSELGISLTSDIFMDLPVQRDAFDVTRLAPGAQNDASGAGFYGSSGAENSYYIDGINTTGIELGQAGKTLNFEFVQEVQVKTAGYNAEYGRAVGALVNVITKSGGNEFHGDLFGYFDNVQNSLSGDAKVGPISGTRHTKSFDKQDIGLDLGGPIVKDKLWFFGAYNNVDNTNEVEVLADTGIPGAPVPGDTLDDNTTRDLWAAKLTWSITPSHSIYGSAFGDPSERKGPGGRSLAAKPLHFIGNDETGATDWALSYDGVLSDRVIITARASKHEEKALLTGPGADTTGYVDNTDPLGDGTIVWGWEGAESGFGFFQNQPELKRDQYNADISYFADNLGGSHEFKLGYEFEDISGQNDNWNGGGGQRIYRFDCDPAARKCDGSDYYYRHRIYVQDRSVSPENLTQSDVLAPLSVGIKTENDAIYLQDTWRPTANLSLNLGVRWETQSLFNNEGGVSADIDDNIAPRLGAVWDPTGTGKAKVFAHWGRFYETIPMDIVIRSFGGEISLFSYNLSDDPANVAHDPEVSNSRFLGGGISRVDPNTKGEYLDEIVVGGEYEVRPGWNVGLKYIKRDLKNVIEDALASDGDYFIGNPGKGDMTGTYDLGYAFGYNETLHPLPVPTREFSGVEFTVSKRMTKNFQFLASALWSELKGSYDGSFQVSTGQLDPNLNSAFDYFDFSVNNEGNLSNDRTWQFKFDGIYRWDMGLTAGLSAFYRSGAPITAMGYSDAYSNWEYYLSERGAFGRVDGAYEMDLHLGYPVKIGERAELNLMVDIFNLLNAQTETSRNIRYTIAQEAYQVLDWETGEEFAPITPGDATRPSTNPNAFNTANAWTNPRRVRFGVRLSF